MHVTFVVTNGSLNTTERVYGWYNSGLKTFITTLMCIKEGGVFMCVFLLFYPSPSEIEVSGSRRHSRC